MSCSLSHHHIALPEGLFPLVAGVIDIALTVVGMIPSTVPIAGQVGLVTDAVSVVLNALLDDPFMMILSVISLIPVAGQLSGAVKIVYRVAKILHRILANPLVPVATAIISLLLIGGVYYFIYYI